MDILSFATFTNDTIMHFSMWARRPVGLGTQRKTSYIRDTRDHTGSFAASSPPLNVALSAGASSICRHTVVQKNTMHSPPRTPALPKGRSSDTVLPVSPQTPGAAVHTEQPPGARSRWQWVGNKEREEQTSSELF